MYPAQVLRGAGAERTGTNEGAGAGGAAAPPGPCADRRGRRTYRNHTYLRWVRPSARRGLSGLVSRVAGSAPPLRLRGAGPVGSRLAHGLARILGNLCSSGYYNV